MNHQCYQCALDWGDDALILEDSMEDAPKIGSKNGITKFITAVNRILEPNFGSQMFRTTLFT